MDRFRCDCVVCVCVFFFRFIFRILYTLLWYLKSCQSNLIWNSEFDLQSNVQHATYRDDDDDGTLTQRSGFLFTHTYIHTIVTDANVIWRWREMQSADTKYNTKIFSRLLFSGLYFLEANLPDKFNYMLLRVIEFSVDDSMSISAAHNCNWWKKNRREKEKNQTLFISAFICC